MGDYLSTNVPVSLIIPTINDLIVGRRCRWCCPNVNILQSLMFGHVAAAVKSKVISSATAPAQGRTRGNLLKTTRPSARLCWHTPEGWISASRPLQWSMCSPCTSPGSVTSPEPDKRALSWSRPMTDIWSARSRRAKAQDQFPLTPQPSSARSPWPKPSQGRR